MRNLIIATISIKMLQKYITGNMDGVLINVDDIQFNMDELWFLVNETIIKGVRNTLSYTKLSCVTSSDCVAQH